MSISQEEYAVFILSRKERSYSLVINVSFSFSVAVAKNIDTWRPSCWVPAIAVPQKIVDMVIFGHAWEIQKDLLDGTSISARLDVRETMDHIIRGVQNNAEKGHDGMKNGHRPVSARLNSADAISLILSKPNIYQILASSKRKSENMRHFTA